MQTKSGQKPPLISRLILRQMKMSKHRQLSNENSKFCQSHEIYHQTKFSFYNPLQSSQNNSMRYVRRLFGSHHSSWFQWEQRCSRQMCIWMLFSLILFANILKFHNINLMWLQYRALDEFRNWRLGSSLQLLKTLRLILNYAKIALSDSKNLTNPCVLFFSAFITNIFVLHITHYFFYTLYILLNTFINKYIPNFYINVLHNLFYPFQE